MKAQSLHRKSRLERINKRLLDSGMGHLGHKDNVRELRMAHSGRSAEKFDVAHRET